MAAETYRCFLPQASMCKITFHRELTASEANFREQVDEGAPNVRHATIDREPEELRQL